MTTTVAPGDADRAAAQARQAVDDAERAIAGGKRVGLDRLTELTVRRRHADLTAQASRAQAERDREQARQEALADLGDEIDRLATDGAEGLNEALADIADAAARARRAARNWDDQLAEVARAARELGSERPELRGARARLTSA